MASFSSLIQRQYEIRLHLPFIGRVKVTLDKILVTLFSTYFNPLLVRRESENGVETLVITQHVSPSWKAPDMYSDGARLQS